MSVPDPHPITNTRAESLMYQWRGAIRRGGGHLVEATFERVRNAGIAYGDGPSQTENMKGPGPSSGVHGSTDSVYFKDPNGHILEILTYDQAPRT